jgi:hypothetical protein
MAETYIPIDKSGNSGTASDKKILSITKIEDIKTIVDLIDYVQRRAALEKQSRSIENMQSLFTIKEYAKIFFLAVKEALGIELFVLGFLGFGIFAMYNAGIFNPFPKVEQKWIVSLFIFLFTFLSQMSYVFAIWFLTYNYYYGVMPRKVIESYTYGKVFGYILKIAILNAIAFGITKLLTDPDFAARFVFYLSKVFKAVPKEKIFYNYLMFRDSLRKEVLYASSVLLGFDVFLLVSYNYVKKLSIKKNKYKEDPVNIDDKDVILKSMDVINNPSKSEGCILGYGLKIYPDDKNITSGLTPIVLEDRIRNRNLAVIGTVGTGKTKMMQNIIAYDIAKGDNVIIIDPKGSGDVYNWVLQKVIEHDRVEDFIYINPLFPEISDKLNPLAYYSFPDIVINTIVNSVKAKDQFFVEIAREITTVIVYSLVEISKAQGKGDFKFTFDVIYEYMSRDKLEELKSSLVNIPTKESSHLIGSINKILSTPPDYFMKVASTLRVLLTVLTTGRVGQILGDSLENDFMQRIIDGKGVVMLVETGSMMAKQTASIVSRMVLSNLTTFAGQYYAERKKFPRPVKVHVDEFYTSLFDGIEQLFDKGREVGISMNVYFQSISQLSAELDEKKAEIVLDTINNYILFRVKSPQTAEMFAEMIGKGKFFVSNIHSDGSLSMIEREDWILLPVEFLKLPDRVFIFMNDRYVYKGKTVFIPDPVLNIKMPELISKYRTKVEKSIQDNCKNN